MPMYLVSTPGFIHPFSLPRTLQDYIYDISSSKKPAPIVADIHGLARSKKKKSWLLVYPVTMPSIHLANVPTLSQIPHAFRYTPQLYPPLLPSQHHLRAPSIPLSQTSTYSRACRDT